MQYTLNARRLPLRMAGLTASILFAACAAAQAATAATATVDVRNVFSFSGLEADGADLGAHPGRWSRYAPVYANDGRLYGTTSQSNSQWSGNHSRWFSLLPDGTDHQGAPLVAPITNASSSLLVQAGNGQNAAIYGIAVAGQSGASTTVRPFRAPLGGTPAVIDLLDPAGQAITAGSFGPAVAAASDGSVFFVSNVSSSKLVWRLNPQGQFEKLADFALDAYVVKNPPLIPGFPETIDRYNKGESTLTLAWSEADQALYGMTDNALVNGKSGDAQTVPGDRAVGTLYRIKASAFKADGTSEIEVLHTFAANRDGTPKTLEYRQPGLVVAGDWIYGTTTAAVRASDAKARQDGRIWRQHKDCVSTADNNCLQIVYRFDTAGALTDPQGGALPIGSLVYAADGNVYGTTHRSGAVMNAAGTEPLGAGTLFRIGNPGAAQLADVTFTQVYAFDVASTGAYPGGLSLGAKADGKQVVLGVAEYGGNAGNTLDGTVVGASGVGAVFAFDAALPAAQVTQFTVGNGASQTIADNGKATLAWASEGAAVCEASGDWTGAQQTSGSAEVGPLAYRAEGYRYTLVCTSADGVASVPASVRVTVQAAPAPTPEPAPQPTPEASSGGGGGGALAWAGAWLLAGLALRRRMGASQRAA